MPHICMGVFRPGFRTIHIQEPFSDLGIAIGSDYVHDGAAGRQPLAENAKMAFTAVFLEDDKFDEILTIYRA